MDRKFTVPEARREFFQEKVSEWSLYKAIRQKTLPCCRIGRRILLSEEALTRWWEAQEAVSVRPEGAEFGKIRRVQ